MLLYVAYIRLDLFDVERRRRCECQCDSNCNIVLEKETIITRAPAVPRAGIVFGGVCMYVRLSAQNLENHCWSHFAIVTSVFSV